MKNLKKSFLDLRSVHLRIELTTPAKLTLKFKKCQFLQSEVNYLGHVITPDGIKLDPEKIEQIKNYKTPTSVDEVRFSLGLNLSPCSK